MMTPPKPSMDNGSYMVWRTTPAWWWCIHSPPCEHAIRAERSHFHRHTARWFRLLKLKVRLHGFAVPCVAARHPSSYGKYGPFGHRRVE